MGWACDPKPSAVLTQMKHAFRSRSAKRWQNTPCGVHSSERSFNVLT